ncbi:MAG: GNAT family N-acetyltransferase [Eubacteriales bacterium]
MNIFRMNLDELTPSQLCISADKLRAVREWFDGDVAKMDPIPVKKLAGRLLMTDGHTRAAAAFLAGADEVPCVWDTDDMDWAAYAADITMCAEEGVTSVQKLAERIVSAEDYQSLWMDRCDAMYDEWYYKVLKQGEEVIFFTRQPVDHKTCDIRPLDLGLDAEYYQLFCDGVPAATGCIEKYSFEFWEAADIRTTKEYRNRGFGFQMTAYLTNRIVASGKTATCRTRPENAGMNRVIQKCGYRKLYE